MSDEQKLDAESAKGAKFREVGLRERMVELRAGRAWMTNATLCLLGVGMLLLTKEYAWEYGGFGHFVIGGSGCSGWSVWLYLAAVIVVMTQPVNRATWWIVVGFAVGMRAVLVFAEPFSSSDIYRYVWDGIAQHAHVNPYRYVPGDAALSYLRAPNQDVFDNINRRDYAHTIYPPVAQMVYWLVTFFSPTVTAMKAAMVGFECVAVAAMVALLRAMGRRREEVLLYAWCPVLVWEIAGGGHVDAVVIAFVALALLARYREQPVWVGLFLGLAVFTKFYPVVLLPALWKRGDWKMPSVVAAVGAVGYAVYSSVGMGVFGFLSGYSKEEGIDSGSRFFLLDLVNQFGRVPVAGYLVFCAVVMGALVWWAWRYATVEDCGRPAHDDETVMNGAPRFLQGAMMLGLAMMLLFSPHYPWYIVWLVPFFALVPNLPLLAYLMAFYYGYATELADPGPKMFLLNKLIYGFVAVMILLQMTVLRRGPLRKMFGVVR